MFAQSYTLLPYLTSRLLFLDCANREHILTLEGKSFVHALTERKKDSMNKSLYGERDYASGQRILTVRTQLGLTQMGLASYLGVSRKAVAWWEAGSSYPTTEHLKQLIALGVQQQAFPAGREAEEIRVLWRT